MKTLKTFFILFLSLFLFQQNNFAQNISHYPARDAGFWNLGINAGAAYQRGIDVSQKFNGSGFGLTLGKNLYYRPNAIFSFDARGRALYAQSFGQDGLRSFDVKNNLALNGTGRSFDEIKLDYSKPKSIGYYFSNYKTVNGSLDLEGVLTFNRLRERTGVVFSLFGGIGLDYYVAKINQRNGNDSYATLYKGVDTTNASTAKIQLKNFMDNTYETIADGNKKDGTLTWMPTLGAELGYQFAPRFHASIFHKINFTRSDVFDGQQWYNNQATYENDWQHYTGLKLEWEFSKLKSKGNPPEIEVVVPNHNPYISNEPNVQVVANIRNVNNAIDVHYKLNGADTRFDFSNPRSICEVQLRPGRNEVEIAANNPFGSDKEIIVIIYETKRNDVPAPSQPPVVVTPTPTPSQSPVVVEPTVPAPIVTITNPSYSPFNVEDENFTVLATILNVKNQRDVRFYLNGRDRSFNFNPNAGTFSSNIILQEGRNEINVQASNISGKNEATKIINFTRPKPKTYPPTVRIISPSNDRVTYENSYASISATTTNIDDKNNIEVRIDGYAANFSFDAYRNEIKADFTLNEGENRIEISVNNRDGNDRDQVIMIYKKKVVLPPSPSVPTVQKPSITINSPNNGQKFSNETATLEARVLNISNKNDIKVYVNNQLQNDFTFNSLNKNLSAGVRLREGANTLSIRADNSAGYDAASVTVYYVAPRPKVNPPSVLILTPKNNSNSEKDITEVRATVQNISTKNQVTITINGKRLPDFSLYGESIEFGTRLLEGNNAITIVAENESGKDQATVNVTYRKTVVVPPTDTRTPRTPRTEIPKNDEPTTSGGRTGRIPRTEPPPTESTTGRTGRVPTVLAPTVTITSVSRNVGDPMTPATGASTVLATVKNVTDKNQVTLTLNGNVMPFDFDVKSGNFSADIELIKGENTIVIKAQTPAGTASDTQKTVY
jgi:hypothetical protein